MGSCCCKNGTPVIHPQRNSDVSDDPLFTTFDSDDESDIETKGNSNQIDISTSDRSKLIDGYKNQPLVSLEEALKPFYGHIDRLAIQIKQAKEQCHHPSEHHLTHDESAAIYRHSIRENLQSV